MITWHISSEESKHFIKIRTNKVIHNKEDNIMNNETIHEYIIKLRGDNIYDLYVDKAWVASRGHYENIIDELKRIMKAL